MAFRRATLRKMPPVTRKYARLLNDLDSVLRRGKNLVEEIQRLELDSRALAKAKEKGAIIGDDSIQFLSK
ncbi:hypothetical protein ES703_14691 [subsurface metagenome]